MRNNDEQITFHTPTGNTIIIGQNSAQFSLIGTELWNADENVGPLFGESLPRIRASSLQAWADIKTVVIGEEGRGANKWRIQFTPDTQNVEQELPPQLAERKGGWYFLRFYDHDDNLTESLDFRFLSALKEIRWDEPSPLPLNGQHKPVQLEFVHEPNCVIEAHDSDTETFTRQVRNIAGNKRTAFTLLADPKYDKTRWRIYSQDGPLIETTVLIERVWWALGKEDEEPSEWTDKTLRLLRSNRSASSNGAIWLRFPRPRWIDKLSVGFATAKKYNLETTKNTFAVPLRDFSDAKEFESIGTSLLKLWMHYGGKTYTSTLCQLVIKVKCKHKGCDFMAVSEREILEHIESTHLKSMFPSLTYEELQRRNPTLPIEIYQCSYCSHFIKGSAHFRQSPTSAILNHLDKEHRGEKTSFRKVTKVDEIRESVIKDLPIIHRCIICKVELTEPSQSQMMQHLVGNHKGALYELL